MSGLGFRLCTNASNLLKFKILESDLILREIIKKFCKHSHQKLMICRLNFKILLIKIVSINWVN